MLKHIAFLNGIASFKLIFSIFHRSGSMPHLKLPLIPLCSARAVVTDSSFPRNYHMHTYLIKRTQIYLSFSSSSYVVNPSQNPAMPLSAPHALQILSSSKDTTRPPAALNSLQELIRNTTCTLLDQNHTLQ